MITCLVQLFRFKVHGITHVEYFLRNIPTRFAKYCFSKFLCKFGMWFFDNKVWKTGCNNIKQFVTKQSISIALLFTFIFCLGMITTAKSIYKPIHKRLICINYGKSQAIIIVLSAFTIGALKINANTAFTVDNASQITEFFYRPHSDSPYGLLNYTVIAYHKRSKNNTLNDLSGWISSIEDKAKVLSASKDAEENPKRFSRQIENIWSIKSKRMLYIALNQQVTLQNQDPLKLIFEN